MRKSLWHIALIARREYLQRVRTKAFIFTTLLMPVLVGGFAVAPNYFATREFGGAKKLVVVSDDAALAKNFVDKLESNEEQNAAKGANASPAKPSSGFDVTVDTQASAAERARLDDQLKTKDIDTYLVLTRQAVDAGTVELHTLSATDLMGNERIQHAVNFVAIQDRLAKSGVRDMDVAGLLKPLDLQIVKSGQGKTDEQSTYIFAVLLVLAMYMPVVIQVVAVMRSVIEEKTSRVMEVMLSTVTPKDLMAGKIIGVGAVGLTQILIWTGLGMGVAFGGVIASGMLKGLHFTVGMIVYFVVFYLLGYLLYSAFAAALGAAVNSEEEAQQLQFIVMLPLITSMMLFGIVLTDPGSTVSTVLSLFPFFAPILMYLRVVLDQPPFWQLALCTALLAATVYGVLLLCARIYRVGILMYGKRPTLPEILKWIRYA